MYWTAGSAGFRFRQKPGCQASGSCMKAVVIILSILVFAACLVIGIQAGHTAAPAVPAAQAGLTPTGKPSPNHTQRTVLLIGVDDLRLDQPHLRSIWAAFYKPGFPHLTALALHPDPFAAPVGRSLPGAFSFSEDGHLSASFVDELNALPFAWDGYILLDDSATALLIDWLGGVLLGGSLVDGSQAAATLPDSQASLESAWTAQADLGQGLCQALSASGGNIDWESLAARLAAGGIQTSLPAASLVEDFQNLLTGSQPLSCEFPKMPE